MLSPNSMCNAYTDDVNNSTGVMNSTENITIPNNNFFMIKNFNDSTHVQRSTRTLSAVKYLQIILQFNMPSRKK
jgi:hypothetical protein